MWVLLYVQVNLKRKHWDPNASQGRASKRCTQIFEQQLANARQQSSLQKVAQPVTSPPRDTQQGKKAGGKMTLKQWQLKKEKASQQATQVHPKLSEAPVLSSNRLSCTCSVVFYLLHRI